MVSCISVNSRVSAYWLPVGYHHQRRPRRGAAPVDLAGETRGGRGQLRRLETVVANEEIRVSTGLTSEVMRPYCLFEA